MNQYKKDRTHESIIKKLLGEKAEEVLKKITENQTLNEFLEEARENLKILENHFTQTEAETIEKLLEEKKEKEKEIKREFKLICKGNDGIITIKSLLQDHEGITYLGNSKFLIKRKSTDLKKTDNEIKETFETIEKESRKNKCEFEVVKH
jgi:translation initiation factor 2 alpha subunit (eIF-2alpha)